LNLNIDRNKLEAENENEENEEKIEKSEEYSNKAQRTGMKFLKNITVTKF